MIQYLLRQPGFLWLISQIAQTFGLKSFYWKKKKLLLAFNWSHVSDILARDNDFRVAPVYQAKMRAVAGDFYLGLDRCPLSHQQRDAAGRAMAQAATGLETFVRATARATLEEATDKIDVVDAYVRPVAAQMAKRLLGVPAPKDQLLMDATRMTFHEVFLNPRGADPVVTQKGIEAGASIRRWTRDEIERRRDEGLNGGDFLGYLMRRPDLADDQKIAILAGHLVGAIDTTTTAFANIVEELLARPDTLKTVLRDRGNLTRLRGWCLDLLRRRPQAPFLPRKTTEAVEFHGATIDGNTTVLAWIYTAHQDPNVVIDPSKFEPDRPTEHYLHFGAGPHVCSGRRINELVLPILLQELLSYRIARRSTLIFDGPFPAHLDIALDHRAEP